MAASIIKRVFNACLFIAHSWRYVKTLQLSRV